MSNKSTTSSQKILFLLFIAIGVFVFKHEIHNQHKEELAAQLHNLAHQVELNTQALAKLNK